MTMVVFWVCNRSVSFDWNRGILWFIYMFDICWTKFYISKNTKMTAWQVCCLTFLVMVSLRDPLNGWEGDLQVWYQKVTAWITWNISFLIRNSGTTSSVMRRFHYIYVCQSLNVGLTMWHHEQSLLNFNMDWWRQRRILLSSSKDAFQKAGKMWQGFLSVDL